MRRGAPYWLLAAAGAVAVLLWTGARASADDGYLLRRVYKAGETENFRTTLKIESGSEAGSPKAQFDVVILGSEKVKETRPDGSVVLEMRVEKSILQSGAQEREIPGTGEAVTTILDKDGRVVPDPKAPKTAGANPAQMLAFTRSLALPDRPLKVGDEYKFEHKTTEDSQAAQSVRGVMTIIGLEKKSAELPADAVKVKVSVDATVPGPNGAPPQAIHVDGHSWVEPDSGRTVMSAGKVTGFKIPTLGEATVEFRRVRTGWSAGDAKTEPGK